MDLLRIWFRALYIGIVLSSHGLVFACRLVALRLRGAPAEERTALVGQTLLLVFGTVSISLFLQGLTMKPLLARLGITKVHQGRIHYEQARARAMMAAQALRELERQDAAGQIHPTAEGRLSAWYRTRRDHGRQEAAALAGDSVELERLQESALHVLSVEEDALRHAVSEGVISDEAADALFAEVAHRREALRHGDEGSDELLRALEEVFGTEDSG